MIEAFAGGAVVLGFERLHEGEQLVEELLRRMGVEYSDGWSALLVQS